MLCYNHLKIYHPSMLMIECRDVGASGQASLTHFIDKEIEGCLSQISYPYNHYGLCDQSVEEMGLKSMSLEFFFFSVPFINLS